MTSRWSRNARASFASFAVGVKIPDGEFGLQTMVSFARASASWSSGIEKSFATGNRSTRAS